jgi:hypothetical protein
LDASTANREPSVTAKSHLNLASFLSNMRDMNIKFYKSEIERIKKAMQNERPAKRLRASALFMRTDHALLFRRLFAITSFHAKYLNFLKCHDDQHIVAILSLSSAPFYIKCGNLGNFCNLQDIRITSRFVDKHFRGYTLEIIPQPALIVSINIMRLLPTLLSRGRILRKIRDLISEGKNIWEYLGINLATGSGVHRSSLVSISVLFITVTFDFDTEELRISAQYTGNAIVALSISHFCDSHTSTNGIHTALLRCPFREVHSEVVMKHKLRDAVERVAKCLVTPALVDGFERHPYQNASISVATEDGSAEYSLVNYGRSYWERIVRCLRSKEARAKELDHYDAALVSAMNEVRKFSKHVGDIQ